MEQLREEANRPEQELKSIRHGWKLGAEDFVDWILEKVEVTSSAAHPARDRAETEQGKAQRIIRDEMSRLGLTTTQLARLRKGDRIKVALARRLRDDTAVTLEWIAETLYMGTSTHVANRLYHCSRRNLC